MRNTTSRLVQLAALAALYALLAGGCVIEIAPVDGGDDNGGETPDPSTSITIRIRNLTNNTLDPQIYLATEVLDTDDLFVEGNQYTNFGVGRMGLLAGLDAETFTIDCEEAIMVATQGGSFGGGDDGNDLNNPSGSGTRLVLTQDLVFFCGNQITLTYTRSGGEYITTLDIDP